jgi:hypothetical protein
MMSARRATLRADATSKEARAQRRPSGAGCTRLASVSAMKYAAYDSIRHSVRELFLLDARPESAASSMSAGQAQRVRAVVGAATARLSVAELLTEPSYTIAALVLYKSALELLLLAIVLSHDEGFDEGADAASIVEAFARLMSAGETEPPPAAVHVSIRVVARGERLAADHAGAEENEQTRQTLATAARWLQRRARTDTVAELRRRRIVRAAAIGAAVLACLVWLVVRALQPTDIALDKPVTDSSRAAQSVAPADGSGLVDGIKEGGYGIQTEYEQSPWVMVDLLRVFSIRKVKIYNRGDGWFDEGLPFVLELSENGKDFVEVSRRADSFSQAEPWVYTGSGTGSGTGPRARYVRVRAPHLAYVALSEVEVYGR